jgi:hypothetical protein
MGRGAAAGSGGAQRLEAAISSSLDAFGRMMKSSIEANASFAEANGNKTGAAMLRATAATFATGSPQDRVDALVNAPVFDATALAQNEKLAGDAAALTNSAKDSLRSGLHSYGTALGELPSVKASSEELVAATRAVADPSQVAPMDALRVKGMLAMSSKLMATIPKNVQGLTGGLRQMITFAQSRNIPVPPSMNAALAAIK